MPKKYDPAELMKRGQAAMLNCQPDVAVQFFSRALEADPNNEEILDTLADTYLQMGDPDNALPVLQRSIALAPEGSPYKYLYIAQLLQGYEALASIEKAIVLLKRDYASSSVAGSEMDTDDRDAGDGRSRQQRLQRQLAKAFCSIAELFLTDLCDEESAEQRCEEALKGAAEVDPNSLDMLQTLASVRCSQCRTAEAGEIMSGVSARVCAALEHAQQQSIMGERAAGAASGTGEECPEHDFCVSTAKILVECAPSNAALAEQAIDLCQMLLEEDDEDVELWYITGMAALSSCPPDTDAAKYHLEHARDMIHATHERFGANEGSSAQLVLIEQRLVETAAAVAEQEIAAEAEEDDEADL